MPETFSISGTFETMSQSFSIVLPVLVPTCSDSPFCSRASTVTSKPFQCSFWLP